MLKKSSISLFLIVLIISFSGCGGYTKPEESPSIETPSSTLEKQKDNKDQEIKVVNNFVESGIVEIVKGEFENSYLTIQIKNLSFNKTISGYDLVIQYLDSNGEYIGDPKLYYATKSHVSANEISEPISWQYVSFGQDVEVYIIMVAYTDGSEWIHPDFKDYYVQQKNK